MATSISILGTSSGVEANVSLDNALFTELRSPAIGTGGVFNLSVQTGAITATFGAAGNLFSMRWTDSTHLCLIRKVGVIGIVASQITTAVRCDAQLSVARTFTANDTAGTAFVPTSTENKLRTSMGSTLFAANSIRAASTTAVTSGTRTLDTNPIGRVLGFFPAGAGGVGGFVFGNAGDYASLLDRTQIGLYPLVLAQNEGIVINTSAAGPATGTFILNFAIEWLEVAAY